MTLLLAILFSALLGIVMAWAFCTLSQENPTAMIKLDIITMTVAALIAIALCFEHLGDKHFDLPLLLAPGAVAFLSAQAYVLLRFNQLKHQAREATRLAQTFIDMPGAFAQMDLDGDGLITLRDLEEVGEKSPYKHRQIARFLREHIEILGHPAGTVKKPGVMMVGSHMNPHAIVVDTYVTIWVIDSKDASEQFIRAKIQQRYSAWLNQACTYSAPR